MIDVILAIVYMIVGCALSIPYVYLADGNFENFAVTGCFAPIASFVLYILCAGERHWSGRSQFNKEFFYLVIFFCFPIIFNGTSISIAAIGYEAFASNVFKFRYTSLPFFAFFFLIWALLAQELKERRKRKIVRRGQTIPPPASKPPEKVGGIEGIAV
jgi:hypothetical protein